MSLAKSLLWALPGGQVSKDAGVFGHEVFGSTVVFGVHAMHFQKDVSRSLLKGIYSGGVTTSTSERIKGAL